MLNSVYFCRCSAIKSFKYIIFVISFKSLYECCCSFIFNYIENKIIYETIDTLFNMQLNQNVLVSTYDLTV